MRKRLPPEVAAIVRDMFLEGRDEEAIDLIMVELGTFRGEPTRYPDDVVIMISNNVFYRDVLEHHPHPVQVSSAPWAGPPNTTAFIMHGCTVRARSDNFKIIVDQDERRLIVMRNCLITDSYTPADAQPERPLPHDDIEWELV